VATPVPRRQRQRGQVPDWAVRAQHRIRQLAQLISARRQALIKVTPEPGQHGKWLDIGGML
jgi:hypothetical protein